MLGWGFALAAIGVLSFLLPLFDRQFILVSLLGLTGMGSSLAGLFFFGIGVLLIGASQNKKGEDLLQGRPGLEKIPQHEFRNEAQELVSYRLDQATSRRRGSVAHPVSASVSTGQQLGSTMIKEEDIAAARVSEIFEQAFMEVDEKDKDRFSVRGTYFPFSIGVRIDSERKTIRFSDYNRLHRITPEGAAVLCNEANRQYILARFYSFIYQDALMVTAEYDMSYEKGIIPFQVISNFRLFEQIAGSSVRDLFKDHLRP